MKRLDDKDLILLNGGLSNFYKYGLGFLLGGITFAASFIYGFIYPEKC